MTPRLRAFAPDRPHVALHDGGPTPVRELSDGLWLKDDGAFGSGGWGGNKVRKLEWLLADERRRGTRTIVTAGGRGTNWGLATALYGREHGLRTALALVDQPVDDHVRAQAARLEASGAELHFPGTKSRATVLVPWLVLRHRRARYLPPGGSTPVGALGYAEAALELAEQVEAGALPEPATVVAAVGTGGTVAGLAAGLSLTSLATRVVGVIVNDALRLDSRSIGRLAGRTAALLSRPAPAPVELTREFLGAGYGHPTTTGEEATAAAAADGLALDPVYTAKAFAAARALPLEPPILFLHTDGPR